jgi:predicted Abi (CAAX) family protease
MSAILSFLGRLLIVTALISSAYIHYQNPSKNVGEFVANYKIVDELATKHLDYDIPYDNVNLDLSRPIGSKSPKFSENLKP